jgi:hypothetical protein
MFVIYIPAKFNVPRSHGLLDTVVNFIFHANLTHVGKVCLLGSNAVYSLLKSSDGLEVHIASIFRVRAWVKHLASVWRRHVPPKRRTTQKITCHIRKRELLIVTAVRTSNSTSVSISSYLLAHQIMKSCSAQCVSYIRVYSQTVFVVFHNSKIFYIWYRLYSALHFTGQLKRNGMLPGISDESQINKTWWLQ